MGLIRDSLSQAMGANDVNNGFDGPRLPFRKNPDHHEQLPQYSDAEYKPPPPYYQRDSVPAGRNSRNYQQSFNDRMPVYDIERCSQPHRDRGFRVVALPSTSFEDGAPFLRGYSDSLTAYEISEQAFTRVIDQINVAIIPNPENQIFQKGANIAGWFVPGAASIGLMAGQVGVGIGAAIGHSSAVAKTLSRANLDLFLPQGLEICIGRGQNLDDEVGVAVSSQGGPGSSLGLTPQSRVAAYGNLIAPLSVVLPPASRNGRNDPIAMLGHGLSRKEARKKLEKAQKDASKGKSKGSSADASLKWLIVRKASPQALDHWQQTLRQSSSERQQR